MSQEQTLRFYATPAHDCSYLPGQKATTLFLDPAVSVDQNLSGLLADNGFRRSGDHYYQPYCEMCHACIPTRVLVTAFQKSKGQRRIWNKNQDLTVHRSAPGFTRERYRLYRRYIRERHDDGDMFPPSPKQFIDFLCSNDGFTQFYEYRKNDRLIAVAAVDHLPNGLSAIYTFFDPDQAARSLGTFCILWQIEESRVLQLDYLYLGYWIQNCPKMAYKSFYTPQERYINGVWQRP